MTTGSVLFEDISQAIELTRSAIKSAEQSDWNQAQSFIKQREVKLVNLPDDYSAYSEQQQISLREQLEQLDTLNTQFLYFVNHSRDEVMQLKSSLSKNRDAINQYLDHG